MSRMPETPTRAVYNEPTVMWRMRRDNGLQAHAVIGAREGGGTVLVWYINDPPFGFRNFSDCGAAIRWSDQLQAQNWAAGWRLMGD